MQLSIECNIFAVLICLQFVSLWLQHNCHQLVALMHFHIYHVFPFGTRRHFKYFKNQHWVADVLENYRSIFSVEYRPYFITTNELSQKVCSYITVSSRISSTSCSMMSKVCFVQNEYCVYYYPMLCLMKVFAWLLYLSNIAVRLLYSLTISTCRSTGKMVTGQTRFLSWVLVWANLSFSISKSMWITASSYRLVFQGLGLSTVTGLPTREHSKRVVSTCWCCTTDILVLVVSVIETVCF